MKTLCVSFLVCLVALLTATEALRCGPCDDVDCVVESRNCELVKDACGCCDVCGLKRGDECTPSDILPWAPQCKPGLTCALGKKGNTYKCRNN